MNSRQINFFILPEDFDEISSFIAQEGFAIIKQPQKSSSIVCSDNLDVEYLGQFHKVYLPPLEFLDTVKTKFIDQQKYYLVEDYPSLAIEFSTGGFYANNFAELRRARLYYTTRYWQDGQITHKDEKFIKRAESFVRKFKKKFLHRWENDDTFWYSERTLKWIKEYDAQLVKGGSILRKTIIT